MPESFTCRYCNHTSPTMDSVAVIQQPSFKNFYRTGTKPDESEVSLFFFKCPKCGEYSITVRGTGSKIQTDVIQIKPNSLAKQYPSYIPAAIRQDYEEAYAIVNLSPKASATLARRCLQGMIHDFWNIHEKNLNAEITALKDHISPTLWKVLDGIRKIGNIGAHMEHDINVIVDIDPGEAEKLLKVIEKLMNDWYIERYETEQLFNEIIEIADTKQEQRKG